MATRESLVRAFDREAPELRAFFIRTNMTRHSRKVAEAMVDDVMSLLRQGIVNGEVDAKLIGGKLTLLDDDVVRFAEKVKREREDGRKS